MGITQAGLVFKRSAVTADPVALVEKLTGKRAAELDRATPGPFDTRNHSDVLVQFSGDVCIISNHDLAWPLLEDPAADVRELHQRLGAPADLMVFCRYDSGGTCGYVLIENGERVRSRLETTGVPSLPPLLEAGTPTPLEARWLSAPFYFEEDDEDLPEDERTKIFYLGDREEEVAESWLTSHLLRGLLEQRFGVCPWGLATGPEDRFLRLTNRSGLPSISFDLADRQLVQESPRHRMWRDASNVYLKAEVVQNGPGWPFDLRDPEAAAAFYGQQCREQFHGVMLEMEVVQCAGHEALRGLFKYRSPVPGSMGMMFVHILWLPFQEWRAQINVEATEHGTTGARETAVSLIEGPAPAAHEQAPVMVSSVEEMFQKMRERPLVALPADDAKYDEHFPQHPLSQVRRQMDHLMASLSVNEAPSRCQPYRLAPAPSTAARSRPWWKLW